MKILFIVIIFSFISCNNQSHEPICKDYQVNIIALETEVDNLFQENEKLKEQLENCEAYLKLLEVDGN